MSIFGNIMSRVLGHAGASGSATTQAPAKQEQGQESAENTGPTGGSSSAGGATAASASSLAEGSKGVDVTAVLDGLAAKNQQKLDWRHSIVDNDEAARPRQQSDGAKGARDGAPLHRGHVGFGVNEHLAA